MSHLPTLVTWSLPRLLTGYTWSVYNLVEPFCLRSPPGPDEEKKKETLLQVRLWTDEPLCLPFLQDLMKKDEKMYLLQ